MNGEERDMNFEVIDLGDLSLHIGFEDITEIDTVFERRIFVDENGRPKPIVVLPGESIVSIYQPDDATEGHCVLRSKDGEMTSERKENTRLLVSEKSVFIISGMDLCKMEDDDNVVVFFKCALNYADNAPQTVEFDEVEGFGFFNDKAEPQNFTLFEDEMLDTKYNGDQTFTIRILKIATEEEVFSHTFYVNEPERLVTFFASPEAGISSYAIVDERDEEIRLGDESQINEMLCALAEVEEIQSENDGSEPEEVDEETVAKVDALFETPKELNELEQTKANLMMPGEIEKLEAIAAKLRSQIVAATTKFNREVLKSQLPIAKRQEMMRDINKQIGPMKAQLEQLEALLPELKLVRDELQKNETPPAE